MQLHVSWWLSIASRQATTDELRGSVETHENGNRIFVENFQRVYSRRFPFCGVKNINKTSQLEKSLQHHLCDAYR